MRTTLYLSPDLHARLRERAHHENTSMSKLVELYCWEGIAHDAMAEDMAQHEGRAATSPAPRPSQPDE